MKKHIDTLTLDVDLQTASSLLYLLTEEIGENAPLSEFDTADNQAQMSVRESVWCNRADYIDAYVTAITMIIADATRELEQIKADQEEEQTE